MFTCYNFIPWKKRVNPDHTTFQKWETVKWALLFFLKCKKIFSFLSGFRKTYFLSGKVFLSLEKCIALLGKNQKNQKLSQSSCLGLIVIYKSLILPPHKIIHVPYFNQHNMLVHLQTLKSFQWQKERFKAKYKYFLKFFQILVHMDIEKFMPWTK